MSPRTGRPKVDNPITGHLSIRIDAETKSSLLDYCKRHKITKGEAIRRGIATLLEKEKK